jgi:hypothetical protein
MITLENFFKNNSFQFFNYLQSDHLVKLEYRNMSSNDMLIFDELKIIVDKLMNLSIDFHILDSGDIQIEEF